jgi:hypothetical protein
LEIELSQQQIRISVTLLLPTQDPVIARVGHQVTRAHLSDSVGPPKALSGGKISSILQSRGEIVLAQNFVGKLFRLRETVPNQNSSISCVGDREKAVLIRDSVGPVESERPRLPSSIHLDA